MKIHFKYKSTLYYLYFPEIKGENQFLEKNPGIKSPKIIKSEYSLAYFLKNDKLVTIEINDKEIKSFMVDEFLFLNTEEMENLNKYMNDSRPKYETFNVYKIFEKEIDKIRKEMINILNIIGWMFNLEYPLEYSKLEFTEIILGGKQKKLPIQYTSVVEAYQEYEYNYGALIDINQYLEHDISEPLEYEFYREAIYNSIISPRSSFVMGFSALEIGVKSLISNLLPETEWLMEKTPTPPIPNIIREYLPLLKYKSKRKYKISKKYLKKLEEFNKKRNKLIHYGKYDLTTEELNEFFELIKNLLNLFQYFKGNILSFEYLTEEFKDSLEEI